ncbi:MAG TPA: hypothetical protein VHB79_30905 [Polyangiaceae bacterium]|nr:hypothetical protein [Polyangiaceae bacterium]
MGLASGLSLAFLISGGLIAERLQAGSVFYGLLIDVAVLLVSLAVMTLTSRPLTLRFSALSARGAAGPVLRLRPVALLIPQVLGAIAGICLTHVVLRHSGVPALSWMCECAPQLVNDSVAVLGVLIAIWACAGQRVTIALLAAMFALLLCYGATHTQWHVDHPPFTFQTTIQELVAGQVLAVATGLLAFRRFSFA